MATVTYDKTIPAIEPVEIKLTVEEMEWLMGITESPADCWCCEHEVSEDIRKDIYHALKIAQ